MWIVKIKLPLIPYDVMYNDHFHTSRFAKNYIPFHILMLVVRGEMDIYHPKNLIFVLKLF